MLSQAEIAMTLKHQPKGKRKAEAEMDARDGDALPDDGKPAQPDERVEPQMRGPNGSMRSSTRSGAVTSRGLLKASRARK